MPGSLWLPQPVHSGCMGSAQGKGLRIPPMDLIPAADTIPLSTSTQAGHVLMLAADSTSQGHWPTAVLHVH